MLPDFRAGSIRRESAVDIRCLVAAFIAALLAGCSGGAHTAVLPATQNAVAARAGAPISMPLDWKQVKAGLDPLRYTVRTGAALLKKSSPWEHYADAARPLASAIRQLTE